MKIRIFTVLLILSCLFVGSDNNYACINDPPDVTITAPSDGAVFKEGDNVTIEAFAVDPDPDGYITKVEFYQGTTKLGEDTSAPYSYIWYNVSAGSYTLKARAYDNGGEWTDSVAVDIIVGNIWYVDKDATGAGDGQSWGDAYNYLQDALAVSTAGDEIRVAEGVYRPDEDSIHPEGTADRTATFQLVNGVAIKGGYAGISESNPDMRNITAYETVLSGDIEREGYDLDNSYHVVSADETVIDNSTILDGFTITSGNVDSGSDPDYYGGGLLVLGEVGSEPEPTVVNCVFRNNKADDYGGGIHCSYASPTITKCFFSNNSASYGGGLSNVSSDTKIINCIFSGNTADEYGGGISNNSSSPRLTNCTFSDNSAAQNGGGIYNGNNSTPTLTNCILWANTAQSGSQIDNDGTSSATVSYSDVQGGWPAGVGNIDVDPRFVDVDHPSGLDGVFSTSDDGLYLQPDSPYNCIDKGHERDVAYPDVPDDDIIGYARPADGDHSGSAGVDMGAYEVVPVWYVDADATGGTHNGRGWSTAFKYLREALTNVQLKDGDQIWVADGTYKPDEDTADPGGTGYRTATFSLVSDVAIYGGFAGTEHSRAWRDWTKNKTILSGDLLGNDVDVPPEDLRTEPSRDENSYHVVTGSGTDATAVLDGFTITGGNGDSFGGGVYNDAGSPTLTNCILTGNSANIDGGGLYNTYSNPTLTNCTISGNAASLGGGLFNLESFPVVANCIFCGNYASLSGGGMYNSDSCPRLTNCTFSGNNANDKGGAIFNYHIYPTIINCIIWGNEAQFGDSIFYDVGNAPGLVAWWKLDEGQGNTAYDSAGNYDGALQGNPTWTTGQIDGALSFDGVDDYIEVADSPELNIVGDITISAWIYLTQGGSYQAIVTKCVGVGTRNNPFAFYTTPNAEPYLCLVRADASQHERVYSNQNIPVGQWRHVLVRVENKVPDFYINGVVTGKSADTTFTRTPTGNTNPLLIGRRDDGLYFNGAIDEVRIYNRALNEDEIRALSSHISYSDIEGCGGSGKWDASFGIDHGGNIDKDPRFEDSDNPAGKDGVFGTPDDGLRLKMISPCIDAADGDAALDNDMCGDARFDMDFALNIGAGKPDYADIGACEYSESRGYITSFEKYQGYVTDSTIHEVDGWQVESGTATVKEAQYKYDDGTEDDYHEYQRVQVSSGSIISHGTSGSCDKTCIRVNCIPSPGSFINVMNGSSKVASIEFKTDGTISIWNNGGYTATSHVYNSVAAKCRDFLNDPDTSYNDPKYSYENTWIEFVIEFDFENHTYDVSWDHWDVSGPASIYTGAGFIPSHHSYTRVEFIAGTDYFELNRMSISDMALGLEGGVIGADEDIWLIFPEADILNPLKGRCIVGGPMWYDTLGEYVIKCCPADLDPDEPDNWIEVCSGRSISQDTIFLGFWNTEGFYNGDYFLKIEIYDDLKQLHSEGIIEVERTFNGRSKMCNVRYPVIGRAKPRTYLYEEQPDVTINWPGTFPFEFKRTYNNGLRARIYPLFFGWTHNHNIRLIEDSQYDWIMDEEEDDKPARDDNGLGIGRLWLSRPLGGAMFIGHVNDVDPEQVIYEPLDNENHYIIRTGPVDISNPDEPNFNMTYVYHAPDGMKMTFQKEFTIYYPVLEDEGLVDWIVVAGIKKQADRFDNALVYEWSGFVEEDGNDVFLDKISAKINEGKGNEVELPANLQFTYDLAPFGPDVGPQDLCSSITLYDGETATDASVWFNECINYVSSQKGLIIYSASKWASHNYWGSNDEHKCEYIQNMEQDFMLWGIISKPWWDPYWGGIQGFDTYFEHAYHKDDGTLLERRRAYLEDDWYISWGRNGSLVECYNYEYDNEDNLITTIGVKIGKVGGYGTYTQILQREEVLVTNPEGALLSMDIKTFPIIYSDEEFDPYDYQNLGSMYNYMYHVGRGGATDAEYYYEDNDFPFKPTTIIEYFDDDGDGLYDRPSKKTTMEYDGRGNLTEQKVYVDSENYVYTEYDYHQDYDFPIRQTTWQGYCHDDGETVVTSGARAEKKWLYGDVDGNPLGEGRRGDYLVQESVLLDDTSGELWADTFYTYIPEGQIKSREDPEGNITYYTYDSYGFKSKEWQGAIMDGGSPTGNPQKRYYYDALGRKILEADYLGKVQMNVCDPLGRIAQARIYQDTTAVSRPNPGGGPGSFEPDTYDAFPNDDTSDDWWESRTLYSNYGPYDKPWEVELSTGAVIEYAYGRGKHPFEIVYGQYPDDEGSILYLRTGDERIMVESQDHLDTDAVFILNVYDSMFRLLHKYSYFGEGTRGMSAEYIKHEEYRYDASGNKIYEAVYSVEKVQYGIFGSGVLEKANSYEYDILGRLTKQVVDCTDGGLNQTTEYGYDAVGNRIYVIDPAGNVIFTDYDNANRKICEYFATVPVYVPGTYEINFAATKTNAAPRKEVSYYKNDKVKDTSSYDYDGTTVLSYAEFTFDSRGRIDTVTEQIDALEDASTQYYYKDDGSLEIPVDSDEYHIVIKDAEHKETGIKLSYHGKFKKVTYPSGDYEEYRYYDKDPFDEYGDPNPLSMFNGLLERKAVWDGSTPDPYYVYYDYDEFGKVNKITYPDGSLLYSYTARTLGKYGKVKQITDNRNPDDRPGAEGSKFTFDYWYLSGNVKSYEDYDGYTVHYDYLRAYDRPTVVHVNEPDDDLIYHVKNSYDLAGRLIDVCEPLLTEDYQLIAGFDYDDNGNRSELTYYRNGSEAGPTTSINYGYNPDNLLTNFTTTGGPTFTLDSVAIDGLGRLVSAEETITEVDNVGTISYSLNNFTNPDDFPYDMRSQLIKARIERTTAPTSVWEGDYTYRRDGNLDTRQETGMGQATFDYDFQNPDDGDIMTGATGGENFALGWDWNGNMTSTDMASGDDTILEYNWDNKLRSATKGADSIALKYDPRGKRIYNNSSVTGQCKYIVDISGKLPTILLAIGPGIDGLFGTTDDVVAKTYIYANSQILAQHTGKYDQPRYFYLHDRLDSVRQITDTDGDVVQHYTYKPFGQLLESGGSFDNSFMFTGQYYDSEIDQYYLRARQYDPLLMRFTGRDPVKGKFKKPMTLHKYLYCRNNPGNMVDPDGKWAVLRQGYSGRGILGGKTFSSGAMFFYGVEEGTYNVFWGYMAFGSKGKGGPQVPGVPFGSMGAMIGITVGWSENTQRPEDLAGKFRMVGGYYGNRAAFGVSVGVKDWDSDNPIDLELVSAGYGYGIWYHDDEMYSEVFGAVGP